ncbi:MAG: multidomain protein with s-layer y region, glug motif, ig motif, i-set domain, pkd domain, partial [Pedosphaera sp.]|nr:multidomain protein with s-layer y region, glug motif, ig motif, i-set domain, pkd domain [Pedosphaera sp.]
SAPNCLGTNDIIIGATGALETTYDINNPNANLFLAGRMNLHQNDTFRSVFVNGVPLAVGTYTFAQLSTQYTNNFPTNWIGQYGASSVTNGSGSITVLVQPVPQIVTQPVPVAKYPTETAQFTVTAQGNVPLVYQWRKGGVNLTDTGNISGSATTNLTITNIVSGNAGTYDVVVTNSVGSVTSLVASLTIKLTGDATNITLNLQQAQNLDWDTLVNWDDGQGGLSATESALKLPGSTYEVLAGARLRTPFAATNSTFPGNVLTISGSGVWVNNNDATIGELRFKHPTPATVNFKKLVMNGGQLDTGDNGLVIIAGELNINHTNAPIYVDSAAANDRAYQIDAKITGSGNIEYHAFDTTFSGGLNITGTGNTYSGTWDVVQGVLLGSGLNSLGTNNITVEANGALETLYNVNNTNGNLILNGVMFLHTADVFKTLTVGGVGVAPRGTPYTWAELSGAFPTNFPSTWPQVTGSGVNTASGSIKVLSANTPPQVTLQSQFSGANLQLSWSQGTLLESTNVTGPWTTNTAPSPYTVSPTNSMMFYRVQVQ